MTETIGIDISARQLTDPAFQSVVRNIDEMNRAAQQSARGVEGLAAAANNAANFFKGAGIGAAIGFAIDQLGKYHAEVKQSISAIQDQADALQISAATYQAYAFAADQVGVKQEALNSILARFSQRIGDAMGGNRAALDAFEKLGIKILDANGHLRDQSAIVTDAARSIVNLGTAAERTAAAKELFGVASGKLLAVLPQLARGMDELGSSADKAGVMIDQKIISQASRLQNQSNETNLAIRRFYAEIGMPIETKYLEVVQGIVKDITSAYLDANDAVMKFIHNVGTAAVDKDIANLEKKVAAAKDTLANPGFVDRLLKSEGGDAAIRRDIAAYEQELEQKRKLKQDADDKYRSYTQRRTGADTGSPAGVVDWVPDMGAGGRNPTVVSKGGGGGGETRDRIQEAINRLNGETKAAQKALSDMMGGADKPLKDLEQQVALQKKIADEIAKLGRYNPSDPRVADIRALVQEHEKAETALKKYQAAARDADQVERQSGDGRLYLRDETQRLNEALDTGRLSYEAYAVSIRQAQEKANDMSLTLQGQQQGFQGLVAGMEFAAAQWERNNRAFQRGQQFFNNGVNLMSQSLSDFVTKGEVDFNRLLGSFVQMLSNMALQAAATSLFSSGSGVLGDLFSGLFSAGLSAGTGAGGVADGSYGGRLTYGGPRASGGPVDPSMIYQVGEHGPEFFIPKTPGNILNASQMNAVGGGGRGDTFIVQQSVTVGEFVTSSEYQKGLAGMRRAAGEGAVKAVKRERQRGGSMKSVFAGR